MCGGRLIAHKFRDDNLNGVQDSGEPNIEGWKMWRCWSSAPGSWGDYRETNSDGNAVWGVKPRLWDVKEQTIAGWLATTDTVVYNVEVVPGGSATVNFGNAKKPIIEVFKFWDKDGDGIYEPDQPDKETLLTDWMFDLYWWSGSNWNLRGSQITGADGKVVWTGYTGITDNGDYKVVERMQDGWYVTTPAASPPVEQFVTVGSTSYETLWFGNREDPCGSSSTTVTGPSGEYLQTFTYEVCQTGYALSHWVLRIPTCFTEADILEVTLNGGPVDWSLGWDHGCDPHVYGLKRDNLSVENECALLSVTFKGEYHTQSIPWYSKFAHCDCLSGQTLGPSCDPWCEVHATLSGGGDCFCANNPTTLFVDTTGTECGGDIALHLVLQ